MRSGNAVRHGHGAVAGDGLEEIMAELSERKEVSGGRAILGWDVAVDRAAWLRFRYAFWGGFAAWALLHLSPLDGSRHMPATFGDAMWLVITAVLAGLAAAGFVGLVAVARKDGAWLRDYWMETFSVTEKAAPTPAPVVSMPSVGGNVGTSSPPYDGLQPEFGGERYHFTRPQLVEVYRRVEGGNHRAAREPYGISTGDWLKVKRIMKGLGYWLVEPAGRTDYCEWTEAGVAWLLQYRRVFAD
jgi:hypothetical protein